MKGLSGSTLQFRVVRVEQNGVGPKVPQVLRRESFSYRDAANPRKPCQRAVHARKSRARATVDVTRDSFATLATFIIGLVREDPHRRDEGRKPRNDRLRVMRFKVSGRRFIKIEAERRRSKLHREFRIFFPRDPANLDSRWHLNLAAFTRERAFPQTPPAARQSAAPGFGCVMNRSPISTALNPALLNPAQIGGRS